MAPGVAARLAALRLLDAVLRRGQPLEAGLPGATRGLTRADDRALVHAIVAETLRRLGDLDALIDSATQRPLPGDAKARMALRIALVQALALGTPGHAAIATVLPLVDGGPRKLVHGVFGALMRQQAALPASPSLPASVAARWSRAWGEAMVHAAANALARPPALDLTLADAADTDTMAARLGGTSLMPGHIRVAQRGAVPDIDGYGEGRWWVQDIAASVPARLIGPGPGTAIDLCAAPGGKTLQLAAAGWTVTAVDSAKSRVARLCDNLTRTGFAAQVVTADAFDWTPSTSADALLLDAPCSATGIFRRHPDVLHRVRDTAIAELAEVQARLLTRAADWVRPGGVLVYATCSLEPEEGEEQIGRFLSQRLDYAIERIAPAEMPPGIAVAPQGWLRLVPGMMAAAGGCDGFFVARMRRAA